MTYKYQVYTSDKKIVQGTIEVTSESLAEGALYRAGYQQVLSLREIPAGFSLENLIPTLFGIKTQEVIEFSTQLATLLASGINILTALRLLEGQATKPPLKKTIGGLVEEIQGGSSFSQALGHYPGAFPDTYCQVIQAGEQAGKLEFGLSQAAAYLEKQAAARQKIQRAMAYPVFVMLMAVAVSVLLITVALPPLVSLFDSLGTELPWTTRLLMSTTGFMLDNGLYIIIVIFAVITLTAGLLRLPPVKLEKDRLLLRLPLIGPINVERSMQRFCRTSAMLLKAGLLLPRVLDTAVRADGNRVIRGALRQVRDRLVQGDGLSRPMSEIDLFPRLLVEMVVVGEKTGAMDDTLATLADFYERKVDRRIDVLISMIEPLLTLMVGAVIIFIALSMFTPLYSILRSIN